jgi:putative cell wall-binding protein
MLLIDVMVPVPRSTAAPTAGGPVLNVIIVGGEAVVSAAVESQLSSFVGGRVIRLAGGNRYETAAAISAATFPAGSDIAFVATGLNFPDALAGGPAAAIHGAPILLVTADSVPAATAAELSRLGPSTIVILGGESVVSPAVASQMSGLTGASIVRLAGSNRYGTAAAISAATFAPFDGSSGVVYIATGQNFPDALSGGPLVGTRKPGIEDPLGPILLVGTNLIPPETATELTRLNPHSIVVLGGSSVVSNGVLTDLQAYASQVTRIAGSNRYATAAAVSQANFDPGIPAVVISTGANYPDALSVGPVAAFAGAPLLLVQANSIPADTLDEIARLQVSVSPDLTITRVDSPGDVGEYTSIGIGGDGLPVIAYRAFTNDDVKVAHCGNVTCTSGNTSTVVHSLGGQYMSLAIGADGLPAIVFQGGGPFPEAPRPLYLHCGNATCSSGNVSRTLTGAPFFDEEGRYTSLAIGGDGLPRISLEEFGHLEVATCSNDDCSTFSDSSLVLTADELGLYSSTAVRSDDAQVVSYYNETKGNLEVAACAAPPSSCGPPTVTTIDGGPPGNEDVGLYTSIAVGTDGNPVISYHHADLGVVSVAHCDDADCTSSTLVEIPSDYYAGFFETSIIIAPDGFPIVSYFEFILPFLGRLMVADCADISCSTGTVYVIDSHGAVGYDSSIAIGTDGLPIISYWDGFDGDLKVAHLGATALDGAAELLSTGPSGHPLLDTIVDRRSEG